MSDIATPRSVSIFGATGSVGTSTLDLLRLDPARYQVKALTAHSKVDELASLAREFDADIAVIGNPSKFDALKAALAGVRTEAMAGEEALVEAADAGADWTMAAIVGCAGLAPTMAAIRAGGAVALANKEALVAAGELMTQAAARSGATLLPTDSEHNAIFQCLQGARIEEVRRITLTASGGPFRTWPIERMLAATPSEAVAHPNWSMGAKISVDSATMMNKGLELIEAHYLFPVGLENLDILVHPQSVIHSMVEYRDRSTLAQLGSPDMKIPIASCLAWPNRMETECVPLDLAAIGSLDFAVPEEKRFPATRIAREAIASGPVAPIVLNAANEVAVAAFLRGEAGFLDICAIVAAVLGQVNAKAPQSIEEVMAIDYEARKRAQAICAKYV